MPPRVRAQNLQSALSHSSCSRPQCLLQQSNQFRNFSQSCQRDTRLRRDMFAWLNGPGDAFKQPLPGSTNYLSAYDRNGKLRRLTRNGEESAKDGLGGDETLLSEEARRSEEETVNENGVPPESPEDLRPFPLNRNFKSESVLNEDFREHIYERVVKHHEDMAAVSTTLGVTLERVAAVVRLKQIEKDWEKEGKKLAKPYSRAVLSMVPTSSRPQSGYKKPFESINDLPVHPATRAQIFYPVSESRHFTREDAAKVFDPALLPADKRIPHPDLVEIERAASMGMTTADQQEAQRARLEKARAEKEKKEKRRQAELDKIQTVQGRRWEFKFQDISVENVGKDGRDPRGVGWRYGFPHEDRKRGQIKIPTRVDA